MSYHCSWLVAASLWSATSDRGLDNTIEAPPQLRWLLHVGVVATLLDDLPLAALSLAARGTCKRVDCGTGFCRSDGKFSGTRELLDDEQTELERVDEPADDNGDKEGRDLFVSTWHPLGGSVRMRADVAGNSPFSVMST